MDDPASLFKLLGDAARLRILRLLSRERLNVSELTSILGIAQSGVSRHLRLLKEGGRLILLAHQPLVGPVFLDERMEAGVGLRVALKGSGILVNGGNGQLPAQLLVPLLDLPQLVDPGQHESFTSHR